ncbi:MAG TPA: DUF1878 family protein [Cerasibacillus sp.]|uniref:DUF1878 family protein n=1 Tax=Cerasibacillus sp. TaxID=2498711 RepID=UPI002F41C844
MQNKTAFHLQLIMQLIDMEKFPLTKLLIEKNVSEQEYVDFMQLLQQINQDYQEQKDEGLLDFTSLLIQFVGMLNEKLSPNETILALRQEGYYIDLMNEFISLLNKHNL